MAEFFPKAKPDMQWSHRLAGSSTSTYAERVQAKIDALWAETEHWNMGRAQARHMLTELSRVK